MPNQSGAEIQLLAWIPQDTSDGKPAICVARYNCGSCPNRCNSSSPEDSDHPNDCVRVNQGEKIIDATKNPPEITNYDQFGVTHPKIAVQCKGYLHMPLIKQPDETDLACAIVDAAYQSWIDSLLINTRP